VLQLLAGGSQETANLVAGGGEVDGRWSDRHDRAGPGADRQWLEVVGGWPLLVWLWLWLAGFERAETTDDQAWPLASERERARAREKQRGPGTGTDGALPFVYESRACVKRSAKRKAVTR
jgi:hypothetical protein